MLEKIMNLIGYIKEKELIKALSEKTTFIRQRDDEIKRLELELSSFIKANTKLYNEKVDLLRLNEQLTKENQQIECLERELSEMVSQNNKLQAKLKDLLENYKKVRIKNGSLEVELSECKTQLEKALSKPFKHAHEVRRKNIKRRKKR